MGMVCSLSRVSGEMVERILAAAAAGDDEAISELVNEAEEADVARAPADGMEGYLDKSWDGLQYLFDRAEVPVSLVWDGEPVSIDGLTASVWTADDVRAAAKALGEVPFERLAEHFDPADMAAQEIYGSWTDDEDLDYLRSHHGELVRYVTRAADEGSALLVSIG